MSRLTEIEKKQANEIAGGNFEKLLAEFKAIQTTFSEKSWTRGSIDKFWNFRAYDIRDIFFLQQKEGIQTELQIFKKDASLDLKKLRRDPAAYLMTPTFLEKRFELFGPTLISKYI